jgi:hypothetical protein
MVMSSSSSASPSKRRWQHKLPDDSAGHLREEEEVRRRAILQVHSNVPLYGLDLASQLPTLPPLPMLLLLMPSLLKRTCAAFVKGQKDL